MARSDQIIIRPYVASDWQAVETIFNSNVPAYFAAEEIYDLKSFLVTHHQTYFVAELDGKIVGCGGFWLNDKQHCARLSYGMISADYHRKSIGTALMHHRLDTIKRMAAVKTIEIDTSQEVSAFYEKFGFRITGIEKNGYGPDLDRISMVLEQVTEPRKNGTYL